MVFRFIGGFIVIIAGFMFYSFPERYVNSRFVRSFGSRRFGAFFKGHQAVYGKEYAIKKIRSTGLIMMIGGFVFLGYSLYMTLR